MSFEEGDSELRCKDCGIEITLDQYRRKVSRCDQCEGDALIAKAPWAKDDNGSRSP